jgi:hypothetical protein
VKKHLEAHVWRQLAVSESQTPTFSEIVNTLITSFLQSTKSSLTACFSYLVTCLKVIGDTIPYYSLSKLLTTLANQRRILIPIGD